jgi:hypothetical protein
LEVRIENVAHYSAVAEKTEDELRTRLRTLDLELKAENRLSSSPIPNP